MLAGQVHGGIAQGFGQAVLEHTVYDDDSGQLLSGSFMDYAIPRAEDLINVDIRWNMVPCETNILQIKGAGEAGAIGAPPAIINALANALNIEHINMPATPNNVWRELNKNCFIIRVKLFDLHGPFCGLDVCLFYHINESYNLVH